MRARDSWKAERTEEAREQGVRKQPRPEPLADVQPTPFVKAGSSCFASAPRERVNAPPPPVQPSPVRMSACNGLHPFH